MATTQCPSIVTRTPSKERSGPDDQTPSLNKLVLPDNSYSYVIIEINIRYLCNSTKWHWRKTWYWMLISFEHFAFWGNPMNNSGF